MNPLAGVAALPRDFRYGACAWRSWTRETRRRFLHMMLVIQSNADSIVRPTAFHRSKSQLYHLSARPRFDETRFNVSRVRHYVRLVIFQICNSFAFLHLIFIIGIIHARKCFTTRFSLELWMNSNWIISRRDWFWKRTFFKNGKNNKYEADIGT